MIVILYLLFIQCQEYLINIYYVCTGWVGWLGYSRLHLALSVFCASVIHSSDVYA